MLKTYALQQGTIDQGCDLVSARLRVWHGNALNLPDDGTHVGYVYDGHPLLLRHGLGDDYRLHPGMYFCLPGAGKVDGEHSSGFVITHRYEQGVFSLGGPIGSIGRFAYINGGTNSLLIPPVQRGAPCLNAMYFPPQVDQTLHTHPSDRVGIIVAGGGTLENQEMVLPLAPGMMFLIPADSVHKFRTVEHPLTAVVFHPDSDTGFTHQDNPMLKRTIVNGVSAAQLPQIQTNATEVLESLRFQSLQE